MSLHKKRYYYIILFFSIFLYAVVFSALQILKYKSFFEFSWEMLAKQNNMIWNTAHGNLFYCSMNVFPYFDWHFEPIYLLIACFYWFNPMIYTLFIFWPFIIALGSVPVFLLTKKIFNSLNIALLFSLTYLMFNPLHNLSISTIRPDLLAITFLLFAFYYYYFNKFKMFLLFVFLSLFCKEDISFVIIMFGILSIFQKRNKIWILTPMILGTLWFCGSVSFLRSVGYHDYFRDHTETKFFHGVEISEIGKHIFIYLIPFIKKIFLQGNITSIMKYFNPPLMYICLFSPSILMLGFPAIVHILLASNDPYLSGASIQHIAFFIPFMFLATIFSFKKIFLHIEKTKLSEINKKRIKYLLIFIFVVSVMLSNFINNSLILPGYRGGEDVKDKRFLNIDNIYDPKIYTMDEVDKKAWKFISIIPDGVSVSASGDLCPALSSRGEIYEFGTVPEINDMSGHENEVDYILIRKKDIYHGYDFNEVRNDVAFNKLYQLVNKENYQVIKEDNDFILLKRK